MDRGQPRIALIHCTEKVSAKFPHSLDYVNIVELAEAGEFGNVIIDGPLDVSLIMSVKKIIMKVQSQRRLHIISYKNSTFSYIKRCAVLFFKSIYS